MATPAPATPGTGVNPVAVVIFTDKDEIKVYPREFWVSREEKQEVLWVCKRDHAHAEGECFYVHFDEEKFPVGRREFKKDMDFAGANADAELNKLYKYTIEIKGYPPLDPWGGVKP